MNKRGFLRNLGIAALGLVTGLPFIKSRKVEAAPEPFEFAETPDPAPDPARFMRIASTVKDFANGKFKIEACSDPELGDWREVNLNGFELTDANGAEIDCDACVNLGTGTIQVFGPDGNAIGEPVPL